VLYSKNEFGKLPNGSTAYFYKICNESIEIGFTNYGCIITSIKVPDNQGIIGEVVLGFESLQDYLSPHPYFGALVGPVANRISGAKYYDGNDLILLDANEGENQLHGGTLAFDKILWNEESIIEEEGCVHLNFKYKRPDGLMGFPGNLDVRFSLTVYNNRVDLNYRATTDKPTPVNLTHHDYFNLKDGGNSSVLDHLVKINAEKYTPTLEDNCVTGEIESISNSAFDFSEFKSIGSGIEKLHGSVKPPNGFDHNFVLTGHTPIVASVICEETGRQLDVYSNKPCIQFYTSNYLDGTLGRLNSEYDAFHGLCLETQSYPDAVNQKTFPSVILKPGEIYDYFTSYVFTNI